MDKPRTCQTCRFNEFDSLGWVRHCSLATPWSPYLGGTEKRRIRNDTDATRCDGYREIEEEAARD